MSSIDIETKPPGYYNVIEYVWTSIRDVRDHGSQSRYAVEANCPCGCGHGIWLPLTAPGAVKREHEWIWDGNKTQPTLQPSIRRLGGCAFHGHLQGGAWSSAGDGAPVSPQVYRGGPDHPVEPRRMLMTETKTATDETNAAESATSAASGATDASSTETLPAVNPTVAPPGYAKNSDLKFVSGKLLQKWVSGHDGISTVWLEVEGQEDTKPVAAAEPPIVLNPP